MDNTEIIPLCIDSAPTDSTQSSPPTLYIEKNFSQFNASLNRSLYSNPVTPYKKLENVPKQSGPTILYAQTFAKPVSKSNPKGGIYNKYGVLQSYDQLLEIIASTKPELRTFNEVIQVNQPVKLTFDLEWCDFKLYSTEFLEYPNELRVTAPQYDFTTTLNEFKTHLFSTAQEIFGKPMDESNLLILKSSRPIYSEFTERHYFKNSFHVYVINYGYLPNLEQYHKQFTKILIDKTQNNPILNNRLGVSGSDREKISHIVDDNVYKPNQNMRCVSCTKPNKNRFFMPDNKDYHLFIRHFFMGWITNEDQPLDVSKLNIKDKPHTQKKSKTNHPPDQQQQQLVLQPPSHLEDYVLQILGHLKPERVKGYCFWFDIMCRVFSIHPGLFTVFDKWSQQASNYDATALKNFWKKLYQSNYNLDSLLELFKEDHPTNPPDLTHSAYGYQWSYVHQKCPRDPFNIAKKHDFWGASYRNNQTDRYINIDILQLIEELTSGQYDTVVIKAPCGSAKSDFLVKLLTLMTTLGHLPDKFLLISALRTLAYSLQDRFMGHKKPYGWGDNDPNPNLVDLKLYTDITCYQDLIQQNINIVINSGGFWTRSGIAEPPKNLNRYR